MGERPTVLALVGPTGTGKTELAVAIARRTGAEIIGADSMQVYRGLDIGTAKPSAELRSQIPHHAIDIVDPDDRMSAGRYAAIAREAALDILARGHPVILCGGTGLYARAFAGGLIPNVASDPELRAELEARSTDALYAELERIDPETAGRIPPANRVRVLRALEVQKLGGRPQSAQHGAHAFGDRPFDVRWLGLAIDTEPLNQRLAVRVDAMFEAGFVDEVRALHAAGYGPALEALRPLGYREIGEHLRGKLSEAEAREATSVATRRYAKRQRTWFRSEPELEWVAAEDTAAVIDAALTALAAD